MADIKEHLADWLRDAYAMEQKAIEIIERQLGRVDSYPEITERLRIHLEETRWQAERVKDCLHAIGEDTSFFKTGAAVVGGNLMAMGNMFASDEIVKDTLANSVFEHMEIACYRSLISAAELAQQHMIAETCREILRQEEAMAEWLDEHIPQTTAMFLSRDMAGATARV